MKQSTIQMFGLSANGFKTRLETTPANARAAGPVYLAEVFQLVKTPTVRLPFRYL